MCTNCVRSISTVCVVHVYTCINANYSSVKFLAPVSNVQRRSTKTEALMRKLVWRETDRHTDRGETARATEKQRKLIVDKQSKAGVLI